MRRDESIVPDDLDRAEGNSLLENYDLHDTVEYWFYDLFRGTGLGIEAWGIDKREDSGEDGLIYSDLMDFRVWDGEDCKALVDIKAKSSAYWLRKLNERHWDKYVERVREHETPGYVVFALVEDEYVDRAIVAPIHEGPRVTRGWRFPDQNPGVRVDVRDCIRVDEFVSEVSE